MYDKRTNHNNDCVTGIYIMINRVYGKADSLQSPEEKHPYSQDNQRHDRHDLSMTLHTGYSRQKKGAPSNLVAQCTSSESTYQTPNVKDTILACQQHKVKDMVSVI